MKKPKNMPPYPSQKRVAQDLVLRRKSLASDLMFMERVQSGGDFRYFRDIVKTRKELKEIYEKLSPTLMEHYAKNCN